MPALGRISGDAEAKFEENLLGGYDHPSPVMCEIVMIYK